tara:strand:+ start:1439 stop:2284 length:846 start_codon:yes stop_codon:yes gene_type:complete
MANFIILKKEDRIKLFNTTKQKKGLSFNKLYSLLDVSRTSFFNYYSRKHPIPLEVFEKLESITKIKIKSYKLVQKERFLKKNIKIPKLNDSLAEIIGALNGDGHVSKYKYEVNIVSDSREKEYHQHLKILFQKTFGINFSSFKMVGNAIKLRIYSVDLSRLLVKVYGLPIGKKKGKLKIPPQILSSKKFLIAYIRGLYDTDGSFYLRRKKDPVIEISSAYPSFLKEVKKALVSLDFFVAKGTNRVFIYRKEHIKRFFRKIKPSNSKHLKKYQNYLNLVKRG